MNIGIDARLIHETGVGRYIQNLIREFSRIDTQNSYVIFLRKKDFHEFHIPNSRWSKRIADVRWHTVSEQFIMPWLYVKEHLDVVHVPYFNAPIFYPQKYIVTIHDLTILHFDTGKASTLPNWLYKIRRIGYSIVLSVGVKRASHIITVSHAVKADIVRYLGVAPDKVSVTYEGIDENFLLSKRSKQDSPPMQYEYFLYVGNVYPHKNIELLLEAFRQYLQRGDSATKLVFIGPSDFFYERVKSIVGSLGLKKSIVFFHTISDASLREFYSHARALLFPSLMEGFGLPAVEAIASGCPVICSDIPVFREILGNFAEYIPINNPKAFADGMIKIAQKKHDVETFRKHALITLKKFSWSTMAQQTLSLYETIERSPGV